VQSVIEADTERLELLKEQKDLDEFLKNVKVAGDDEEEEWDEAKEEEITQKRERVQEVWSFFMSHFKFKSNLVSNRSMVA